MKLTKLKIGRYKNLRNLSVDFERTEGVAVLAGVNGSGKSNLLEALGRLFARLLSAPGGDDGASAMDAEVVYRNGGVAASASVRGGQVVARGEDEASVSLIAMYSGSSSRLGEALGLGDDVFPGRAGSRIWIVDNSQLNAACLVLMLLAENRESLKRFLRTKIGLKSVVSVCLADAESGLDAEVQLPSDRPIAWRRMRAELDFQRSSPREVFEFLRRRVRRSGVRVTMTDGAVVRTEDLSEGEQRLVLLRLVYEVLADENSLILLDEPDAYLHEAWKRDVFDEIKSWSSKGRMTVLSTHSPSLIDTIESRHLIVLRQQGEKAEILQGDKLDAIKELTGGRMMLFGDKPILLFEGHSDIQYVRRAAESLKRTRGGRYLEFDFTDAYEPVFCGGTGEVPIVYERYRRLFPERPIAVVCDHDPAGRQVIREMAYHFGLNDEQPTLVEEIEKSFVFMLPQPRSFKQAQKRNAGMGKKNQAYDKWAIEDYLGKAFLNGVVRKYYLDRSDYVSHLSFPKIKDMLKRDLAKGKLPIPDKQWGRYAPLIDKLMAIRKKLCFVDYRPRPKLSIVWPVKALDVAIRQQVELILRQDMCELALIGNGVDVESDAGLSALAKQEYRFLRKNRNARDSRPVRSTVTDDMLHSSLRLDIAGVKAEALDLEEYLRLRDGDMRQAKSLLETLFDDPVDSYIERTKQ